MESAEQIGFVERKARKARRTYHVICSGFRQRKDRPHDNGMIALRRALRDELDRDSNFTDLYSYRDDVREVANSLLAERDQYGNICVKLYGYSYGGHWVCRLAQALHRRGVTVTHVVLCDPVRRYPPPFWAASLLPSWCSILRFPLRLPHTVLGVTLLQQRTDLPCGFDVYHRTKKVKPERLLLSHVYMDNSQTFMKRALAVAREQ